jgi:signal transduction histidine kinase
MRTIIPWGDTSVEERAYHHYVKNHFRGLPTLSARATDLYIALALTVVDVASILPYRDKLGPFGVAVLLVAAQSLPLLARRQWPVITLLVIGSSRIAFDVAGFHWAPLPLAVGLAVYTVADQSSPRSRRWVAAFLVAGILASQFATPHNQPYDATFVSLFFLTAWIAGVASRNRRSYTKEVELRADRAEEDRDHRAVRAAMEERSRIARELHDVVAHHVALIAIQAEAAGALLPERPFEAAIPVAIVGDTARQALTELRQLLGVLRSPEEPLETSPHVSLANLDDVIDRVRDAGVDVTLTVSGADRALPELIDITAYRIIQEALTNSIRHAQANQIKIALDYAPGQLFVSVTDLLQITNTKSGPVRTGSLSRSPGFGLTGIAERVASCSGMLTVGPTPEGGFSVAALLPTA